MKIESFLKEIEGEIVVSNPKFNPQGVYIGDLLSLVMGRAKADDVWITIQGHLNIIAVASLVDIAGIVVVEGMEIDDETIEKAKEEEICLIKTQKSAYEVAKILVEKGL